MKDEESADGSEGGSNANNLSADELQEFRELFDLVDLDKGGSIEPDEIIELMETLGLKVDKDELKAMILEVDEDGSGQIEFDEFVEMMSKKVEPTYTAEEVADAFKVFESSSAGPGLVNLRVIDTALKRYGVEGMTDAEIEKQRSFVMAQLEPSANAEGKLNYTEYIKYASNS